MSPRAQDALRAARALGRGGGADDADGADGGGYRDKDREAEKLLAQILNKPVGVPKAQFYSAAYPNPKHNPRAHCRELQPVAAAGHACDGYVASLSRNRVQPSLPPAHRGLTATWRLEPPRMQSVPARRVTSALLAAGRRAPARARAARRRRGGAAGGRGAARAAAAAGQAERGGRRGAREGARGHRRRAGARARGAGRGRPRRGRRRGARRRGRRRRGRHVCAVWQAPPRAALSAPWLLPASFGAGLGSCEGRSECSSASMRRWPPGRRDPSMRCHRWRY